MIRKVSFSLIAVLATVVFSCKLPTSSTHDAATEGSTMSLEDKINAKYPNWKVKPQGFENNGGGITEKEIKFILKTMARIRLLLNTDEFKSAFLVPPAGYSITIFVKTVNDCPESPWVVKDKWAKADLNRAYYTLANAESEVIFVKRSDNTTMYGDLGDPAYTYMDYKPFKYGKRIYLMNKEWNETCYYNKYVTFIEGVLHEYTHLLGYGHEPQHRGVPHQAQTGVKNSFDAVMSKYSTELNELEEYYLSFFDDMKVGAGSGNGGIS